MARSGYRIVHHAEMTDGSRDVQLSEYDVVRNSDGEVMNEKPLHVRAAERLVARLSSEKRVDSPPEEVRSIVANQEIKITWKKLGGGSFRMKSGRIIKPNQVFEAFESEIPPAFRDVVVPMQPIPEEPPLEVASSNYRIISKGPGWYDILDSHGKKVNEKSLRQPEAQAMLEGLMK